MFGYFLEPASDKPSYESNDTEGEIPRAFPILPILCLILFNFLILCTISPGPEYASQEVGTVTKTGQSLQVAARDVRPELVSGIAAHAPSAGEHSTAIAGLRLFRRSQPTACYRAACEPSLTVFVQGKKRMNLGGTEYLCGPSSFFLSSIDVPVQSQIVEASEEVPLLSMLLRLEMPIVREILSREELPEAGVSAHRRGVGVGEAPAGLLKACSRLMELLDTPEDIPFLSHLIQREIIYRILRTPQGERLRTVATTGELGNRTARAITWLRDNYTKRLHMEELAAIARLGVSTLHHQFRALTAMSPLQYQKQLRLQRARERMLMDGMDATSAAYEVGYESVSQFNREYSRFFGQPPMRDIKALRAASVVA
jgi:AraC-like DNA-binding protein